MHTHTHTYTHILLFSAIIRLLDISYRYYLILGSKTAQSDILRCSKRQLVGALEA